VSNTQNEHTSRHFGLLTVIYHTILHTIFVVRLMNHFPGNI